MKWSIVKTELGCFLLEDEDYIEEELEEFGTDWDEVVMALEKLDEEDVEIDFDPTNIDKVSEKLGISIGAVRYLIHGKYIGFVPELED